MAHDANADNRYVDDEIDLAQVLRYLWRGRWRIVAGAALALLAVLLVYGFGFLSTNSRVEHSIVVQLTFPNAADGRYPDGTRFVVSDIAGADVLAAVHAALQLDQYGLDQPEFAASIDVQPYAVTAEFIALRYKERLAQKDLAATEIETLEAAYKAELQQNSRRFARLSLSLPRNTALPGGVIDDILNAIPRAWSETSIQKRGVLDIVTFGTAGLRTDNLFELEYTMILQRLEDYGSYLQAGLGAMMNDNRFGTLRDAETGMLPRDVERRLDELIRYQVKPLALQVLENGLVRDAGQAGLLLRSRIQELADRRRDILRKADRYAAAIRQFGGPASGMRDGLTGQGALLSVDPAYVDHMLDIGSRLSEAEFRHDLVTRQLEYEIKAEDYTTQIETIERELALLDSRRPVAAGNEDVDKRVRLAVAEFEFLVETCTRLAESMRRALLSDNGALYTRLSTEPEVHDPLASNFRRLAMLALLALFVGAALGGLWHLFLGALRPVSETRNDRHSRAARLKALEN